MTRDAIPPQETLSDGWQREDKIARIIDKHVRSEPDKNFIERRWLVGVSDAAKEIASMFTQAAQPQFLAHEDGEFNGPSGPIDYVAISSPNRLNGIPAARTMAEPLPALEVIAQLLIKELTEPARSAFWIAIAARNALRDAPSHSPAGTEFDPEKLSDDELEQCMEEQRSRDAVAIRAYAPAESDRSRPQSTPEADEVIGKMADEIRQLRNQVEGMRNALQKIADLVDAEDACEPLDDAIEIATKALSSTKCRPDWCQGADSVCHHPACACVVPPQKLDGASQ